MSRNYKVSVVIATYNRSVSVERALNALSDQTFPTEDYEVVVSIDGSLDGTREMVDKYESDYYAAHQRSTRLGVIGAVPIIVDLASSPVVRYVGEKFNSHLRKLSAPEHGRRIRDFYSGNFSIRREDMLNVGKRIRRFLSG